MADVLIVGAGAAGLMAAGAAARLGHAVTVLGTHRKTGPKDPCHRQGALQPDQRLRRRRIPAARPHQPPVFVFFAVRVPPGPDHGAVRVAGGGPQSGAGAAGVPGVGQGGRGAAGAFGLRFRRGDRPGRGGRAAARAAGSARARRGQKGKEGPGLPLCGGQGRFGQELPGGLRPGGDRRSELPGHRLHRRRLQAGPAGRPTPSSSRCPAWSAWCPTTRTAKK